MAPGDHSGMAGRPAPWTGEWKRGPIPEEIGFHGRFGGSGISYGSTNGKWSYSGNKKLIQLLSSKQVWHAESDRCSGTMEWHNGNLLIIDPKTNKVWLSVWDW